MVVWKIEDRKKPRDPRLGSYSLRSRFRWKLEVFDLVQHRHKLCALLQLSLNLLSAGELSLAVELDVAMATATEKNEATDVITQKRLPSVVHVVNRVALLAAALTRTVVAFPDQVANALPQV